MAGADGKPAQHFPILRTAFFGTETFISNGIRTASPCITADMCGARPTTRRHGAARSARFPIKTERIRTNGKAGLRDVCGGSNERQRNGLLRFGRNASADAFAEALIVRRSSGGLTGLLFKAPASVESGGAYIKKTFSSYNRSTYNPSLTVNDDAGGSQTVANGTYARSGVRLMVFLSNAVSY